MVLRVCAAICGAAILFVYSSSATAKPGTVDKSTAASRHDACAMGVTIVGTASMYDPFQPGYKEGGIETASGELYDRMAWTAAIQTDLRETFGGIRYGNDYRPTYALVEVAEKRSSSKSTMSGRSNRVASSTSINRRCAISIQPSNAESFTV
jgi:peptidoglycan lytic transglycosylase